MAYTPGNYSESHIYVQWGGKLPGGEQWSCGIRMRNTNQAGVLTAAASGLAGYAAAIQTYHTSSTAQIAGSATLSFVKSNAINIDGTYLSGVTNEQVVADVAGGGASVAPHPNQVALAVSLVTGFSRGPAHRGRFFMPLPVFMPAADGLISTSDRNYAKGAAETLRTSLNAVTSGWNVAVMSRKSGAPAARNCTGIEVGRVLDTQRRRRRSLKEMYV